MTTSTSLFIPYHTHENARTYPYYTILTKIKEQDNSEGMVQSIVHSHISFDFSIVVVLLFQDREAEGEFQDDNFRRKKGRAN